MKSRRRTFLAQLGLGTVGIACVSSLRELTAGPTSVDQKLPRSTPEAQGVSSKAIVDFLDAVAASKHEFHSFMLVRHGKVVAEGWWFPYRAEAKHTLYSLSKSFTSTAVGLAIAEGRLKVNDAVTESFRDDLPREISDNLAALQVKDLLTMSVGHAEDSTAAIRQQDNWVKAFLALPIKNPPGTHFLYNSGATYMLSAIVQKLTGETVLEYLRPRLFGPLAIDGMTWQVCPRGINTGGWGLSLPTEALAKFGQLYLQKGQWNGQALLPAGWIDEATSFKIQQPAADLEQKKKTSDWHQGYCYQFWRCRHNAFRGDGAFGQFTIVLPDEDAVIAITSESSNMQGQLDLVWEHILPGLKSAALPPNETAEAQLSQKLCALTLQPPKGQALSPAMARIQGKTFKLRPNIMNMEGAAFKFEGSNCAFQLRDNQTEHTVVCGLGKWVEGQTSMPGTPPSLTSSNTAIDSKIAASSAWRDENTFDMTWQFYETPHHDSVTCRFEDAKVRIEFLNSITRMSPGHKETRPTLEGTST